MGSISVGELNSITLPFFSYPIIVLKGHRLWLPIRNNTWYFSGRISGSLTVLDSHRWTFHIQGVLRFGVRCTLEDIILNVWSLSILIIGSNFPMESVFFDFAASRLDLWPKRSGSWPLRAHLDSQPLHLCIFYIILIEKIYPSTSFIYCWYSSWAVIASKKKILVCSI